MYLTTNELSNYSDIPLSIPLIEIKGEDYILVSSFQIDDLMSVSVKFLQLTLTDVYSNALIGGGGQGGPPLNPCSDINLTPPDQNRIDQTFGLLYIALYKDFQIGQDPENQNRIFSLEVPPQTIYFKQTIRLGGEVTIKGQGNYSLVLRNNMYDYAVRCMSTGSARISLS